MTSFELTIGFMRFIKLTLKLPFISDDGLLLFRIFMNTIVTTCGHKPSLFIYLFIYLFWEAGSEE